MYMHGLLTPVRFARWRAAAGDHPDDIARALNEPKPGLCADAAELVAWTAAREFSEHHALLERDIERIEWLDQHELDHTLFATPAVEAPEETVEEAVQVARSLFERDWTYEDAFMVVYGGFLLTGDDAFAVLEGAK
jgi:hypothetical protein